MLTSNTTSLTESFSISANESTVTTNAPDMDFDIDDLDLTMTEIERTLRSNRRELPIYSYKQDILQKISSHPIVVISGPTGKNHYY
jgi:HrpA-like RNA helicase